MGPRKAKGAAPRGTKHKQKRSNKKKDQQLQKKMGGMTVEDSSSDDMGPYETTAQTTDAKDGIPDTTTPPTLINTLQLPLSEEWEQLEGAEIEEVTRVHQSTVTWKLPELLPVKVHVAAPQAGRFTREVESDIEYLNSIEAVKDFTKDSLIFELKRTNIDVSNTKFAGLMVYGPTTEFDKSTIKGHTRGLFLQEVAFKKWWLGVIKTARKPGDMVKIAVVLMHADEAASKQVQLPDFWTEDTARILGNHLEKLEMPLWDLDIEAGCRAYVMMQKQVQNARTEREYARAKTLQVSDGLKKSEMGRAELQTRNGKLVAAERRLTKAGDKLANAARAGNLEEINRMVGEWKKATGTISPLNATESGAGAGEEGVEEAEDDDGDANGGEEDSEATDEGEDSGESDPSEEDDDSDDADYVE